MSKPSEQTDTIYRATDHGPSLHVYGQRVLDLEISGRLPSWNQILAMSHWQRNKFKKKLAQHFLYELQVLGAASSTKTTCANSLPLMYAATLVRYLQTHQTLQRSKSRKSKSAAKNASAFASK